MLELSIPLVNLSGLQAEIDGLNKRAAKLKIEQRAVLTVGARHEIKRDGKTRTYVDVTIDGGADAVKLNGWRLIARIEPTEAGNLIKAVPGESVPEQYRASSMYCDHCKTDRYRKEVFVVAHDDGRYAQVGRNCIADFLGNKSAEAMARAAEWLASIGDLLDEDGGYSGGGRVELDCEAVEFVATCAAVIRWKGWAPRSAHMDGGGTADRAWWILQSSKEAEQARKDGFGEVEARDIELAEKAIAWARNLEDVRTDYLYNLRTACTADLVTEKTIGIVASVIAAYQKEIERQEVRRQEREQRAESHYLGEIGKRQVFTDLTVASVKYFEGAYGVRSLVTFTDAAGNVLTWWTGSNGEQWEEVEHATVKGTIKDHKEYGGTRQTVLTRVAEA